MNNKTYKNLLSNKTAEHMVKLADCLLKNVSQVEFWKKNNGLVHFFARNRFMSMQPSKEKNLSKFQDSAI